jgi:uncharacterized protein (TIGR02453 family)
MLMSNAIPSSVFTFLNDIRENNNREWFTENKTTYQKQHEAVVAFADALINRMQAVDNIETPSGKKAIFRIYKDVRFSKDKSPYKTHIGGHLSRATKLLRGGYYFHIEPGNCFIGGGFWNPSPDDLKHIREQIAADPQALRDIIESSEFKKHFGTLEGEQLKTAPKGYDKNHPAIDLLNYKQFLISKKFDDALVTSEAYLDEVFTSFQAMRPFFDYMSEILTTDLNGELIV